MAREDFNLEPLELHSNHTTHHAICHAFRPRRSALLLGFTFTCEAGRAGVGGWRERIEAKHTMEISCSPGWYNKEGAGHATKKKPPEWGQLRFEATSETKNSDKSCFQTLALASDKVS